MKKLWIRTGSFILACILCLGAMTSVFADYSDADTVTLTGSGTVFIPADIAVIRFCIETHAKKESSAKAQNDEILETLMAYEEDFGQIAEDSYCGMTAFSRTEPMGAVRKHRFIYGFQYHS